MSKSTYIVAITLMLASTAAARQPAASGAGASVYSPGSQYTATLSQSRNQWRMQPVAGQDVVIDTGSCSTGAMLPPGVWLLVRDKDGRLELLAPSVTQLPAGSPDHVALRACDKASGRQLAVPQTVLDLLAANTGAVYVQN